jgi:hypothetical protein
VTLVRDAFSVSSFKGYVIIDMLVVTQADVSEYQFLVLYATMAAVYVADAVCYFMVSSAALHNALLTRQCRRGW